MTNEEYARAADYWRARDAGGEKLPEEQLRKRVEEYISEGGVLALATGHGDEVRCTPVEYAYRDGAFWIFTEGGEKFIGLAKNRNVSLAIFDKGSGFAHLKGLQVQGVAEVIEPFSQEYIRAAQQRNIPVETLRKLPEPIHLLRIVPVRMTFLNSDFRREGYSCRQEMRLLPEEPPLT